MNQLITSNSATKTECAQRAAHSGLHTFGEPRAQSEANTKNSKYIIDWKTYKKN